jgi:NAD(P)-dependent dehydrogenase (short-subunit alcohol dehydrogenase family)
MKLENKIAIVTGACSGIGKAVAEEFLKQGASVIFSDINEIKVDSEKALFIKCDVSKSEEVNNLIEETIKKFGRIDIMVNNAGIGTVGDICQQMMNLGIK